MMFFYSAKRFEFHISSTFQLFERFLKIIPTSAITRTLPPHMHYTLTLSSTQRTFNSTLYHCAYLTPHSNHVFLLNRSLAPSSLLPCKYFLNSLFPPNILYKSNFTLPASPFLNLSASFSLRSSSIYTSHKGL